MLLFMALASTACIGGTAHAAARQADFNGDGRADLAIGVPNELVGGQAGAAGGFLGMTETIRQLTDTAGPRTVPDAKLGLVAGFGMVTYDRCLCTGAVILGRSE